MASGWNLWVQLECIGVVSGCLCIILINTDSLILYLTSTPVVRKCQASRKNGENPGKLSPCPEKCLRWLAGMEMLCL